MNMVNITLNIDEDVYRRMKEHSEYRWSEVARQAIEKKLDEAELIDDLNSVEQAKEERATGKTISFKQAVKKLGLENEI